MTRTDTLAETAAQTAAETATATPPRQTLAMRLAERERQRAERAERLARLRSAGEASEAGAPVAAALPATDDAEAALEDFLRALTGGAPSAAPVAETVAETAAAVPEPAAVLHFQRPEAAAAPDLDRLPGAGPGLVGALRRAGIERLADLAPLQPAALVGRLGPIGRLIPAEAWIAFAREATREAVPAT